ncbi:RHS domain-containing protein [Chitinibacter fontanus]|uniref:RHS domain-containing protein n=1 Tax=Chitinibacter fontanus TaxID=1737446 RepID=A0A7D5ZJ78_9NEIS|nr:RHS domain-containing protein [Chitinibacter fontanus]
MALEQTAEQTRHYLFEAGSFVPLAQVVEKDGGSNTAYYYVDHLGTPQLFTGADGEVAWSAEYKAWGAAKAVNSQAANSAGIDNPIRFQGQYFDAESGLHYNRHRYYDPEIGRFISSDPIGLLGGLNTHAYAPNPVEWIDPLGLVKKKPSVYAKKDGEGATPAEIQASKLGGGNRKGQQDCREKLLNQNTTGVYRCWRCGHTSTNPDDMHLGHKNVPTAKGGNLADLNVELEDAACNLSAGSSGYVKEGISCVERGSCGAPYGR